MKYQTIKPSDVWWSLVEHPFAVASPCFAMLRPGATSQKSAMPF